MAGENEQDWRVKDEAMYQRFAAIFNEFLRGDQDAVAFCMSIAYIAHLWDDLIDKDKERTPDEINRAFMLCLSAIPANRFFQAHTNELTPLMTSTLLKWQSANVIERGDGNQQLTAFVIRQGIADIFHYCMYLTGGYDWAVSRGPDFWTRIGNGMVERFEEFKEEMR